MGYVCTLEEKSGQILIDEGRKREAEWGEGAVENATLSSLTLSLSLSRQSFAETIGIDLTAVGRLLPQDKEADLLKTCHGQVDSNVRELMGNMVKTEQEVSGSLS